MKITKASLRRVIKEEALKSLMQEQGPMGTMVQDLADKIDNDLKVALEDFFQTKVGPFASKNLKVKDVLPKALAKTGMADQVEATLTDIVDSAMSKAAPALADDVLQQIVTSMPAAVAEASFHGRRRLFEEHGGAPCPHATAAAIRASGMHDADIIGWVADLLNDLRPGDITELTQDDLLGMMATGIGVVQQP